jgi:hypothetical protein
MLMRVTAYLHITTIIDPAVRQNCWLDSKSPWIARVILSTNTTAFFITNSIRTSITEPSYRRFPANWSSILPKVTTNSMHRTEPRMRMTECLRAT